MVRCYVLYDTVPLAIFVTYCGIVTLLSKNGVRAVCLQNVQHNLHKPALRKLLKYAFAFSNGKKCSCLAATTSPVARLNVFTMNPAECPQQSHYLVLLLLLLFCACRVDTSKIKRKVQKYNDALDDYDLLNA